MIDSSSSSTQLKDAISAVESLLGEADCSSDIVWLLFPSHQAKRELKNKQLSGPHMATARQRGMLYVHFKSLEVGHFKSTVRLHTTHDPYRTVPIRRGASAERHSSNSTRPWRRRFAELTSPKCTKEDTLRGTGQRRACSGPGCRLLPKDHVAIAAVPPCRPSKRHGRRRSRPKTLQRPRPAVRRNAAEPRQPNGRPHGPTLHLPYFAFATPVIAADGLRMRH